MFPVRCFSCGKVVRGEQYLELRRQMIPQADALDQVGAVRRCCRRMYIAQPADEIEELADLDRQSKRRRVDRPKT